jgi:hypothetical protein
MSATPSPTPALPTSTAAAPKTTKNPAAGVLDDFSFLNVLVCLSFKESSRSMSHNQNLYIPYLCRDVTFISKPL